MLYEEAEWIGDQLSKICKPGTRLLNVGSSSLYARTIAQPHMEKFIFLPLKNMGVEVIHTDIQNEEGVDIIGNLTDDHFIKELKFQRFDYILCSNLLEHIENKEKIIDSIEEITPSKGHAIITVPYLYPYHLDPIDTLFRPTVKDLTVLFKNLTFDSGLCLIAKRVGQAKQKNYFEMLKSDPKLAFRLFIRILLPFYKYKIWKQTVSDLTKLFKPFQVTCVVFKK